MLVRFAVFVGDFKISSFKYSLFYYKLCFFHIIQAGHLARFSQLNVSRKVSSESCLASNSVGGRYPIVIASSNDLFDSTEHSMILHFYQAIFIYFFLSVSISERSFLTTTAKSHEIYSWTWFGLVLWYINYWRLFNAKSGLYIYNKYIYNLKTHCVDDYTYAHVQWLLNLLQDMWCKYIYIYTQFRI